MKRHRTERSTVSQGETPGTNPSFTGLRWNQPCQLLDFGLLAFFVTINFCCLNHPVCDTLLWQSYHTNTQSLPGFLILVTYWIKVETKTYLHPFPFWLRSTADFKNFIKGKGPSAPAILGMLNDNWTFGSVFGICFNHCWIINLANYYSFFLYKGLKFNLSKREDCLLKNQHTGSNTSIYQCSIYFFLNQTISVVECQFLAYCL